MIFQIFLLSVFTVSDNDDDDDVTNLLALIYLYCVAYAMTKQNESDKICICTLLNVIHFILGR